MNTTSIQIQEDTRERLATIEFSVYRETYDSIINTLIDLYENEKAKNKRGDLKKK